MFPAASFGMRRARGPGSWSPTHLTPKGRDRSAAPSRDGAVVAGSVAGTLRDQSDRKGSLSRNRPRSLDSVPCLFLAGRMARDDEPIRPMTLGSMRRHGVRGLFATCQHCGHERAVNMDDWPDDAPVPSFGPRMRCSHCGKLGATAIPNWVETADRLPGARR
jgi:hypothetical protein